jgi:hypothetical protein
LLTKQSPTLPAPEMKLFGPNLNRPGGATVISPALQRGVGATSKSSAP